MNQEQPQPSFRERILSVNAWGLFLCRAFAVPIEVFLRRGLGEQYLGFQALAAVGLLLVWGVLWEGHDLRPLWWFLVAYLFMCGVARGERAVRRWRGKVIHSRHGGTPRLMLLFRRWNELTVKKWIETPVAFFAGVFLLAVSQPLGSFIMVAAIAMHAHFTADCEYERRRAQDIYDAYVEQKYVTERFRDMRGDRF